MFHDADLMPFRPRRRPSLRAMLTNYMENFPPESYTEGYSTLTGIASIFVPTIFLTDPELIEDVLVKRADLFVRDQFSSRAMSSILDPRSMFLAEGADWRWQRRAMAPAFRYENLLALVPHFVQCAKTQIADWRQTRSSDAVDITKAMTRTTFDVIMHAVFGDAKALERETYIDELRVGFEGLPWQEVLAYLRIPASFPHPGCYKARAAIRGLKERLDKTVSDRRAAATDRRDILGLLLSARDPETGRVMNDSELASNLYTFIAAGHETTAMALSWTLWLLAKDQTSQDRVREEALRVAGARDIDGGDIDALAFTKQVAQEAMRLFPPVAIVGRQAKEDTTVGPYAVSRRAQIIIPVWSLHRNSRLWDDPMGFDPDRFAPERAKARHPFAYLPFGGGPRICIGMYFSMLEMTAILATLVRDFRFKPAPGYHLKLAPNITLRPDVGPYLMVEPV